MRSVKIAFTRVVASAIFLWCTSLIFPVGAHSLSYVSESLGVVDSNNQPVSQLFGSAGNVFAGPVPVSQSLILGPPATEEFVSFTLGQEATFGLGNINATQNVFVAVVANGAGETGTLFGRAQAADPWVLLGTINEPLVGGVLDPPNINVFSLASAGLSQVNQLRIVSSSSAGSFPGLDVQGLGADINAVPEPGSVLLMLIAILGFVGYRQWRLWKENGVQAG